MRRGLTMAVLLLIPLAPLLLSGVLAAPRSGDRLEVADDVQNPFTPGPEQLSLLQEFLQDEDPLQENPKTMKRETVILHLFVLHDFDKSGDLDGLELLRLLRRILTKTLQREPAEESVVLLVDDILVTQDLNHDGLLSAQELVTPPLAKAEDSPSVNMAIPIPPAAPQIQADSNDTSEAPPQEEEAKDPAEEQILEKNLPSEEAETTQEDAAAINHEAAANESEEVEETAETDSETHVIQEVVMTEEDM